VVGNIHNVFAMFMEVVCLTEALLVAGWKEWLVLKQEKQSSLFCFAQAVMSQLFILNCCCCVDAIIYEDWRITYWHLALSLSVSKGSVVTSLEMLDFWWCAWVVFLGAWQLNTKPREKPFLSSCWHVLKLRERPFYPRWLQQMNPGSIILNLRQKVSPWNDTILYLHGKQNYLLMGKVMISHFGLWSIYSCVCVMLRGETVNSWSLHQDADRSLWAFQTSLAVQEFDRNLAWAWQCKDAHKFEDWETVTVFGWTLYPHLPNCPDLAPPDFHLFGALKNALLVMKFETDDYVICAVRT
jgi:hypothetical protein